MDRSEFGELYHRVFGKGASRENCRQAWQRWQAIWGSGLDLIVLHPPGAPALEKQPTDYYLIATCSELRFLARASQQYFGQLSPAWEEFSRAAKLPQALNRNPRSAARTFLHNMLVDGYGQHPTLGPAMGGCIAWLVASHEIVGCAVAQRRMLGVDIAYVPGPVGQARMFNFRLIMAPEYEPGLLETTTRALPFPSWQPPPH
jgi:hypothetical protein